MLASVATEKITTSLRKTDKNWTPILEITRQFKISNRNNICVLHRQFLLRPAAANIIYRSQGDTLDEAVVDFSQSIRDHMHVGLSRKRSISNLRILNLNEQKISVSKKVKEKTARLRTDANLKPCIPFLYQHPDASFFKILFQNVCSLHLHMKDVAADYNIQEAHNNIFVETALWIKDQNDTFSLKDFTHHRNDWKSVSNRTNYETAVYIRQSRYNYNDVEITCMVLNEPVRIWTYLVFIVPRVKSNAIQGLI